MSRVTVFLDIDDVIALGGFSGGRLLGLFRARDERNVHVIGGDRCVSTMYGMDRVCLVEPEEQVWATVFDPTAVQNIAQLHEEFVPQWVVSSSWRAHFSVEMMREIFTRTELSFVAENLHTTWKTPVWEYPCRLDEILDWLRRNQNDGPWIAIDDPGSGGTLVGHENAVLCPGLGGFMQEQLDEARNVLAVQIARAAKERT